MAQLHRVMAKEETQWCQQGMVGARGSSKSQRSFQCCLHLSILESPALLAKTTAWGQQLLGSWICIWGAPKHWSAVGSRNILPACCSAFAFWRYWCRDEKHHTFGIVWQVHWMRLKSYDMEQTYFSLTRHSSWANISARRRTMVENACRYFWWQKMVPEKTHIENTQLHPMPLCHFMPSLFESLSIRTSSYNLEACDPLT